VNRMVPRRDFLRNASYLGLLSLPQSAFRMTWAEKAKPQIGIQLYSVRDILRKDPLSTLTSLYEIGFREVETAGYANLPAEEFARMVHKVGFACPSAHLDLSGSELSPQFAGALALGAKYATTGSLRVDQGAELPPTGSAGMHNAMNETADMFKKMAEHMNNIAARARSVGLTYAYHNHTHEFARLADGRSGYDLLIHETDPDLVKFEIDCGWMIVAGSDPVAYMTQYPDRIRMLHIKDFKAKPSADQPAEGAELGTGFIDYRPILETGRSIGIEHYFAEQEGPYLKSELDSARFACAYLKSSL
jgi:sugar phosphate isomerase/epimerase